MSYAISNLKAVREKNKAAITHLNEIISTLKDTKTARDLHATIFEQLKALALDVHLAQREPESPNKKISILIREDHVKELEKILNQISLLIPNLAVNDVD